MNLANSTMQKKSSVPIGDVCQNKRALVSFLLLFVLIVQSRQLPV